MLTLRKPIVIKTAGNLLRLRDGFAQRIDANYGMMSVRITSADMIHFMTAPPNVYIQKGGMTSLVHQSDHTYSQNVKLQLINNMLNRILVSDTIPMTYQDSIFVTHMMRKIGVTDVEEFVRQFWLIQNDLQSIRQLTALYQSKRQQFKAFLEHQEETFVYRKEQNREHDKEYQTETFVYEKGQNGESSKTQNKEYWLHQSILDRLHTGEIYSEIRDFTIAAYHAENRIYPNEIRIGEQIASARKILLNKRRDETLMKSRILAYNHHDSYELGTAAPVNTFYTSDEQIIGDLAGAVLLNALTQIYAVCLERQERTENNWYAITDFLNQTAKNTISRFQHFVNRFQFRKSEKAQFYGKTKIPMLQRLFTDRNTMSIRVENQQIENTGAWEFRHNTVSQNAIDNKAQNRETAIPSADTVNYHAVSNISASNSNVGYDEEQMIRQQLEIIHNSNLERVEQIRQLSFQNSEPRFQKIDMEKAREDILRTVAYPNEVVTESMHSENHRDVDIVLHNQELRQIIGEETVRAFAEIKKLHERSESSAVIEEGSVKAFDRLVHDVSAARLSEQIKRINAKQDTEESEHTKSIIQTDLSAQYHKKYDTSVIKLEKPAVMQNNIRERYETMYVRTRNRDKSVENNLELFHKQTGSRISEETLNELIKSSRQVSPGSTETTEKIREINSMTENTNNSFHVIGVQQKKDMERMISQNINRQLRELSEQVYTKLERRMDSERRRRGL